MQRHVRAMMRSRLVPVMVLSAAGAVWSACGAPSAALPGRDTSAAVSATPSAALPTNQGNMMEDAGELIRAAERGDTEAVERVLAQGVPVDGRDGQGRTALIAAAYRNHVAVAEALIAAGADVNLQDITQQSAYLIATSEVGDDPRLLLLTLRIGANVASLDSFNGTGLIRAAERGHVLIVEELLRTGITVDHVNRLGWTALLEAIILGDGGLQHTAVVRLLVDAGADVNLADRDGVTPLAHARDRGYGEIAAILERAGAR